jgi:hypothetical protein
MSRKTVEPITYQPIEKAPQFGCPCKLTPPTKHKQLSKSEPFDLLEFDAPTEFEQLTEQLVDDAYTKIVGIDRLTQNMELFLDRNELDSDTVAITRRAIDRLDAYRRGFEAAISMATDYVRNGGTKPELTAAG